MLYSQVCYKKHCTEFVNYNYSLYLTNNGKTCFENLVGKQMAHCNNLHVKKQVVIIVFQ